MRKTTKKEHYVNNKEFTAAVAAYNASVKEAKAEGKEPAEGCRMGETQTSLRYSNSKGQGAH